MPATEAFWKGDFGDAYTKRNAEALGDANPDLFRRMLAKAEAIESFIEFGANIGNNLRSLSKLYPTARYAAVEINSFAASQIPGHVRVFRESMLDRVERGEFSVAFTKGVLIHIAPDDLPAAYDALYRASARYILTAEYFSSQPTEVPYRGENGRLWKRDFAGELLDNYPSLQVVDYGFEWRRGELGQDDLTWALLEKT